MHNCDIIIDVEKRFIMKILDKRTTLEEIRAQEERETVYFDVLLT